MIERRNLKPGRITDGNAREMAQAISWKRRDFLRAVTGASAGAALFGFAPKIGMAAPRGKKAVVVTFGGGARDEETFMPEGQENIPHLLGELIPQATFFTQVVNRGILGHYVATASLATGVYETFNNFAAVAPEHPTVFEYFRKDLKRPASDAWVVAPSNGFNRIGESGHGSYGPGMGAGVILPKRLLASALTAAGEAQYEHLLRDNYETPLYTPELRGSEVELHQMAGILKLSVTDFTAHARSLASPDELSVYIAKQLMRQLAPSLLWITLHDIDIAHSGTYSLYVGGDSADRPVVRGAMEDDSERAGVCGQDEHVHPAGFRQRFRYGSGRQWISASSHGRSAVAHHVDDGDGTGRA